MMATAPESDDKDLSSSDESDSSDSSSDTDSDAQADSQPPVNEPCKYYNKGNCLNGSRCPYMHLCKYALKGNCKYGSTCKLNHPRGQGGSSQAGGKALHRSKSRDRTLTAGQYYKWQLNDGTSWKDIDNDYIIEAQYCLPHSKSIKIYNTPYGAVSIGFNRMKVYGKSLRVRRLDDGNTIWNWYCTLRRKWIKYGEKDSKGNISSIKSSEIEQKFKRDRSGSFTFNVGNDTVEIRFREMRQVSKKRKRKVTRRPVYRHRQGAGVSQARAGIQNMSLGTKPKWQFEGSGTTWYDFKRRTGTSTECSVTSEDIERKYQQNPRDSMIIKVKGDNYKLDFRAMNQTNLRTKSTRKIRRVLV